jgi:hypothetical protein
VRLQQRRPHRHHQVHARHGPVALAQAQEHAGQLEIVAPGAHVRGAVLYAAVVHRLGAGLGDERRQRQQQQVGSSSKSAAGAGAKAAAAAAHLERLLLAPLRAVHLPVQPRQLAAHGCADGARLLERLPGRQRKEVLRRLQPPQAQVGLRGAGERRGACQACQRPV